jgi:hypothetical protein
MLGVLLALILIAVLRNGMQLANLGGSTQDVVIGGLLLGAILAGNLVRAVRERGLPWQRARTPRKEVSEAETQTAALAVEATLKTRQGG